MIENKLKEMLNELKKFKVHIILVLDYKKRNNRKISHSNAKLITSDPDIDEAFKSKHQSIMKKNKKLYLQRLGRLRCSYKAWY